MLHLRSQTQSLPLQWKTWHAHGIRIHSLLHSRQTQSQTRDNRKAYTILLQILSQSAAYIIHSGIPYLVAHHHFQKRIATLHPLLEHGRSGFQIARERQHPQHQSSLSLQSPLPPFSHTSSVSTLLSSRVLDKQASMSKAIDDPVIISVPADYIQEGKIRAAIASSSNDYCSRFVLNWIGWVTDTA